MRIFKDNTPLIYYVSGNITPNIIPALPSCLAPRLQVSNGSYIVGIERVSKNY